MPATRIDWSAEEARALPDDGNRYEVLDGELFVTPAPSFDHQEAAFVICNRIRPYVRRTGVGFAAISPADIEFSPSRLVQPDVFVVCPVEGRRPRTWRDIERLILAVEVLSPSTARADRNVKRRIYQEEGVGEYWIVDVSARLIERWRPQDERPEIAIDTLTWQPEGANEPLVLQLAPLFAEIVDDAI